MNRLRVLYIQDQNEGPRFTDVEETGGISGQGGVPIYFKNVGSTAVILWVQKGGTIATENLSLAITGFTATELQPGEEYIPAWAPFYYQEPGATMLGNGIEMKNVFAIFRPSRLGSPAGNRLVVVRQVLEGKRLLITTETVRVSGSLVLNCFAARLLNQGLNTVMVGDISVPAGKELEVKGEPGFTIDSPLLLTFADGTSGREIVDEFPLTKPIRNLDFDPSLEPDPMPEQP
ncbi:hypothetical protein GCM10023185_38320 [Hymenobacter saemangeumensis]|uniref:Uncharacterized protein n=1 Tax=Hymenobacter saemangeumensis TaxID=1084522 RepID=A0ABP8IRJ7_9BACT